MILPQYFNGLGQSFLKNDILSIDIGFTNTKVVHARKKAGNILKIVNFGIGSTPPGCIKNGVIYGMEGIVENLRKVIEENRLNEKNVKIVISAGSNIISRISVFEKKPAMNLEEAVKEALSRDMPVDINTHKLFYRITGELQREGRVFLKALVTIVPNSIIDNYVKVINSMNFKPLAVEVPFSSVARFFSRGVSARCIQNEDGKETLVELDKGATAVVDLGSETTNLSILNKGTLEFNRIILSGGRSMDELISAKLGIERETAERYKKMHGILTEGNSNDDVKLAVSVYAREYLKEILWNVKRSIEFYSQRCGGEAVDKLVFIGGGSALKGLVEFAREIIGIPAFTIEMLDFKNIQIERNLDKDKIRFLVNAVGISL